MRYFIIMMFLVLTSGTLTEKSPNVCITVLDTDGVRLNGIRVRIYEAGRGWHVGATDKSGEVYFTVSPANHCDVFVQNPTHFLDPKPTTSFIVDYNKKVFYLTIYSPYKWPGQG